MALVSKHASVLCVSQHDFCPTGEKSWCSYQKTKTVNKLSEYKHETPVNSIVFDAVKPIKELSNSKLLSRLGGFTQNRNESFNVWALAPKSYSSGKKILDIVTNITVCNFNFGFRSIMKIMKVLNLVVGPNYYNFCEEADAWRVKMAERSLTGAAKEVRKSLLSARKEVDEANAEMEEQLYGAGITD
ncbi:uncharacterized protein LOC105426310 [Pogonomyrmex barbatus]|uniref:Uncharacterized protein LOC105426310 n=1 Tax=Pogonomyrmex barbatus TaxID=144034 RepID=A0A6I9WV52_9HYME|nr:uncharacterized protein LOC105426310 [Pogonomyrmex barbatus]